ncbi:MAG: hypothetical protein QOD90_4733 [Mycobacterium sp.]|nr:hypothetical protein [Mycobacterium sp.]
MIDAPCARMRSAHQLDRATGYNTGLTRGHGCTNGLRKATRRECQPAAEVVSGGFGGGEHFDGAVAFANLDLRQGRRRDR